MSRDLLLALRCAAFATVVAVAAPAHAVALQVSPVRVNFQADQRAQAIQVANSGKQVLEAQVRVMRWTQENGEDRLTPAEDVVASPAILRVTPGQPQTVRLVRIDAAPKGQEQSYRLLVDELPTKDAGAVTSGLKVLMRYSIPVFVAAGPVERAPKKAAAGAPPLTDLSRVRAQLVPGAKGGTELRVRNDGPRHLRISHLSAAAGGGTRQSLGDGLIGYVLPGQQMAWPVTLPQPLPTGVTLQARFNDDREAQVLPLDGAGR